MTEEKPKIDPVTQYLQHWKDGDPDAMDKLMPLVYQELHQMAQQRMRREGQVTLQPTALVHEAYMRLVNVEVEWQNRAHFFALASSMMRRILVDEAKRRRAAKRGGGEAMLLIEDLDAVQDPLQNADILALDGALEQLRKFDERKMRVIELRFFAGLTIAECAEVLKIGHATVERDLKMARAWLAHRLTDGASP